MAFFASLSDSAGVGLFVVDRADGSGTVYDVGAMPGGTASLSSNGHLVAFGSYDWFLPTPPPAQPAEQIWVLDTSTDSVSLVSARPDGTPGNSGSFGPVISADGSTVVYATTATNLTVSGISVPFVVATSRGASTTRVVGDGAGVRCSGHLDAAWPTTLYAVSGDGHRVIYVSRPDGFGASICVRDLTTGAVTEIDDDPNVPTFSYDLSALQPTMSDDGRVIAYNGETNLYWSTYVRDLDAGVVEHYGAWTSSAAPSAPALTPDGRRLVFTTDAADVVAGDTNGTPDVFEVARTG